MGSDNPTGADDQQETARPVCSLDPQWVVGFIDGEGCFSVSIHRNPLVHQARRWQVLPVFQAYQHQRHRAVLEELVLFFGVGRIRPKGPKSSVLTFAVDGLRNLEAHVVPFFEQHELVIKREDFRRFAEIVRMMRRKEHLTVDGFERVVRLAYGMNADGKQRSRTLEDILAGSSETVRRALSVPTPVTGVMRQSDPHSDMRSQAEMTWP